VGPQRGCTSNQWAKRDSPGGGSQPLRPTRLMGHPSRRKFQTEDPRPPSSERYGTGNGASARRRARPPRRPLFLPLAPSQLNPARGMPCPSPHRGNELPCARRAGNNRRVLQARNWRSGPDPGSADSRRVFPARSFAIRARWDRASRVSPRDLALALLNDGAVFFFGAGENNTGVPRSCRMAWNAEAPVPAKIAWLLRQT